MTSPGRSPWWAALVAGLGGLLLGIVLVVQATGEPEPVEQVRGPAAVGSTAAEDEPSPAPSAAPPARQVGRAGADLQPAAPARVTPPARLRAAAIDLTADVVPVGVARDGQMSLPDDPRVLGWYRFGPAPGSGSGSAVLAGHVDSERFGVGPLARLGELRRGDAVEVRLDGGERRRYRIDSIERFDREALPAAVFDRTGPERLRLVTCTGAYLPEAGGYEQNLVVTAVPERAR